MNDNDKLLKKKKKEIHVAFFNTEKAHYSKTGRWVA